jgi:hypothetical protein
MLSGFELGEVDEVGKHRQRDIGAHVGQLKLAGDQPEMLGRLPGMASGLDRGRADTVQGCFGVEHQVTRDT